MLDVLKAMKAQNLEGLVGGAYYYYEIPKNPVNDWLVREHKKRLSDEPPDFFTAGGFAAAMAVVAAIQKAGGTDTEKLIAAMEGMDVRDAQGQDDVPQGGSPGAPGHVRLQAGRASRDVAVARASARPRAVARRRRRRRS